MTYIQQSVGDNGAINDYTDVHIVQVMINNALSFRGSGYKSIDENGRNSTEMMDAIEYVQRELVHLAKPDRRIDPRGLTIRVLRKMQPKVGPEKNLQKIRIIKYRRRARKMLSQYSTDILNFIMQLADVEKIDISSTHRGVKDQARIMFNDNMAARRKGISVKEHRGYGYKGPGASVDKVFARNVGKVSSSELKKMMGAEISAWLKKGKRTSKHCVEDAEYSRNNIFDIPYSGVAYSRRDEFEQVLLTLANRHNYRKYSKKLKDLEGYDKHKLIDQVIVESKCWHVEIPQDAKKIPKI